MIIGLANKILEDIDFSLTDGNGESINPKNNKNRDAIVKEISNFLNS